jgi:DNA-binding NarL/FixJ family response regulator
MTHQPNSSQHQATLRTRGQLHALILDDNRETLNWISESLATALTDASIETAATCAEARKLLFASGRHFDFALIDLDLPDGSGVEIIRELAQHRPETMPVVITVFEDATSLFEALAAGAMGYILKGVRTASLIEQFRRIQQGEPPISPRIAQRILAHFKAMPAPVQEPVPSDPSLTRREQEVLRYLGKGLTIVDIAQHLGISANTCATHTKSIYRKLNISNRAEAALAADRRGLI